VVQSDVLQPGIILATFGLVAVAELPDKTMIATLILGSRHRPLLIWAGATVAFGLHAAIAVAAGQLLHLLPHRWTEAITALLFAAGALYLLLVDEKKEEEEAEKDTARAPGGLRPMVTAFAVIFVGEFGDLTQILTANLAAKYHAPFSVFIGAFAALAAVAGLAAVGGRALLRVLPLAVIRRTGGVLLGALALYSLVTLVRG
jgi:putative Ca2+/H+ antiporter (TMEM165/GDT1 family)